MKIFSYLLILFSILSCSSNKKPNNEITVVALPSTLKEAVNNNFRSPENRTRDKYRHPLETLNFFGIEPEMTVVEIFPGGGWYTEILAPYLAARGTYIMAIPPTNDNPYSIANAAKIKAIMERNPVLGDKMKTAAFNPPYQVDIAADNSADLVLTFRNVHNWMTARGEKEAFRSFYKVLKPGGILGVVEHRSHPKYKNDATKTGYVKETDVIKMATTAGFKLLEKSEINANALDTKDYPEGVWTLPPTKKSGEKDREKYEKIGESDRMTLKFEKPLK